ncbi:MAG TPA: tRNA (adenosine(37)-N6)-dimethylallyltransferase MiaA [Candidatus Paceibacterota bacterium]|nr:tRNA (adenosine(37)-N6)-dimethylallyltransferase MiaA [Candidatus Paceibacterota bacterium]
MTPVEKLPKIIAVVGPTASGKTDLAIKIARKFAGEIVSADSRQIYKGMDIGTAKPSAEEMAAVKHYLIDIKKPDEDYTVAEYKNDAIETINKIIKRGKIPVLAGGTGLYIKAVVENLEIPSVKPDWKLRKKLEDKIKKEGLEKIYGELIELDPEAAYIVDGKNTRRVIRALEVAILSKKPFSAQRKKGKQLFETLEIGIGLPYLALEKRIDKRIDGMIENGLLNEVKKLIKKYGDKQIAFDAIGYREIINYLAADNISVNPHSHQRKSASNLKEVAEMIKKNTRAFSKRQMTWFKKDKNIKWIKKEGEALKLARKFLKDE